MTLDTGAILLDGVPLPEYDLDRPAPADRGRPPGLCPVLSSPSARTSPSAPTRPAEATTASSKRRSGREPTRSPPSFPKGYDTPLTRKFEGGVELSGGEWQKVALARGFVRDAALVILDEPTAALDAEAEYRLFEQFRELVVGKTALLISHRFSTVRMADHIIVLEEGKAIEAGSHDELVAQGGRYATLYEMQAGRYR